MVSTMASAMANASVSVQIFGVCIIGAICGYVLAKWFDDSGGRM